MIFFGAMIGSFAGTAFCLFLLNYLEKDSTRKQMVRIKVSSREDMTRLLRYLQKTDNKENEND